MGITLMVIEMAEFKEMQQRKLSEFTVLKNPKRYIKKRQEMSQSQIEVIIDRVSLYRYRIDLFVEEYLGIQLKLFQIILLFLMQTHTYFMYLASRGLERVLFHSYILALLLGNFEVIKMGNIGKR